MSTWVGKLASSSNIHIKRELFIEARAEKIIYHNLVYLFKIYKA
jgi:hypothetical protein